MAGKRSCLLALLVLSLSASAQDSLSIDLDQVVVTGTRTPKLLAQSPVLTQVITSEDIRKADAANLADLLQTVVPGVEFSFSQNQVPHMNFAGFGGQSVLVLVDGERLAGENMDDTDFARLTMDGVERVEIVKGASSALYGSGATGAVINIITKKGIKPFALTAAARLAKHDAQRYTMRVENAAKGQDAATGARRWSNAFDLQRTSVGSYDLHSHDGAVTRTVSTIFSEKVWNVGDRFTLRPVSDLNLTARAAYFFRELPRSKDIPERYRDLSAGLRAELDLHKAGRVEAAYSFDQYDKSDFQRLASLDIRDYSNVQNALRLLYDVSIGNGELTAGADYMHDYLFNDKLSPQTRSQDQWDVFAQWDWTIHPSFELVAAVRYDAVYAQGAAPDAHTTSDAVSPKLSARYTPLPGLNIRAGFGLGFRPPTMKEKYYDFDMSGIFNLQGNPNLKPEKSWNHNLSIDYSHRNWNITASAYFNKIHNKIASGTPYYAAPSDLIPTLPYVNLAAYHVTGADITLQGRWRLTTRTPNLLTARLAYAYTHERLPHDKQGNTVSNQYIKARPHAINLHADLASRPSAAYELGISIDGRFLSAVNNREFADYYDLTRGTVNVHYPAYTLWKLATTHTFPVKWPGFSPSHGKGAVVLNLAVDNILNYRPRYHYLNAPVTDGANFIASVALKL